MSFTPHTWIELDFTALAHNIASYKKIIGNRLLAPVIKSNGYGHGLFEIASFCDQSEHVDWLCVALLSDALALRRHGIRKPILVLSTIDCDPSAALGQEIQISISDYDTAAMLQEIAYAHNSSFAVHLKVDTGLARLGVAPDYALDFAKQLRQLPNLRLEGIYTHCAESQKEDQTFTWQQINVFQQLITALHEQGIRPPYIHAANTAATGALDLPWCNLFRVGAGIYGLWPSPVNKILTQQRHPGFDIQPILQWKSRIIQIKQLGAHQPIGYDRTYLSTHPMTLAIIPTGYYDGYDFRLANQGRVLIRDSYAPIVGRVSMNMTTLDITDIPQARVGDSVLLMGNKPYINPYDIGAAIGNPNVREIMTKINPTIKRIGVYEHHAINKNMHHAVFIAVP